MSEQATSAAAGELNPGVAASYLVKEVPFDAPWGWLAAGWRDLWAFPVISLTYGVAFAAIGYLFVYALMEIQSLPFLLPLAAGFLLVGPLLGVGLYEISRRIERGESVTFKDTLFAWRQAKGQLAFFGVFLLIVKLFWIRLAFLLFMIFYGTFTFPPIEEFIPSLLFTQHGLGLLITGTVTGAVLALFTFATSAISVPMLLDRKIDAITAIAASLKSLYQSPKALLLWAALIAALMLTGVFTLFLGVIIAFPLIGHATWHAYQDLVGISRE